eukprot:sb/3472886/
MSLHARCRNSPYDGGKSNRFPVPDAKVPWSVSYPEYSPASYTSPAVAAAPVWADPEKGNFKFNALDDRTDRRSVVGEYKVVDEMPVNPVGRTGIKGRGLLGKWGPNHAADPVVTRWKRDEKGAPVKVSGKGVLEFHPYFAALCPLTRVWGRSFGRPRYA